MERMVPFGLFIHAVGVLLLENPKAQERNSFIWAQFLKYVIESGIYMYIFLKVGVSSGQMLF